MTIYQPGKIVYPKSTIMLTDTSMETSAMMDDSSTMESMLKLTHEPKSIEPIISVIKVNGSNILGLIVFSIAFGVGLGKISGEEGKIARQCFEGMNAAVMTIVRAVIWYMLEFF